MGKAEDERLQRYFDGELSPEERARVEAELSDEDRLKLAALGEVRGLVANALAAEAADVDLWPALEKQLAGGSGGGRVGRAEARARRRWGFRAHPASWSSGFLVAAAAALLLILQPWHSAHAQNGCEIESLEADQMATVMNVGGAHVSDEPTTVIWTMEDD
jgi:anti-sigma factor RsiW